MGWLDVLCGLGAVLAAGVAVTAAAIVVNEYLDKRALQKAVRQKAPNALKAKIYEMKSKAVKVGVFGEQNQELDTLEIQAERGISDDLRVGQEISLYN